MSEVSGCGGETSAGHGRIVMAQKCRGRTTARYDDATMTTKSKTPKRRGEPIQVDAPPPPTDSIYIPRIREQWAKVDATTLAEAAPRLGISSNAAKSRRDRDPERFPRPLPIDAKYFGGLAIYSFHELALMRNFDWDIRNSAVLAEALRRDLVAIIDEVQPVSLSKIAELCNVDLNVARSTWRGGRVPAKGSRGNGFPFALSLKASHTMSTMLYSWPEIEAWIDWWYGDPETGRQGYKAHEMGAITEEPTLHEYLVELETRNYDHDAV